MDNYKNIVKQYEADLNNTYCIREAKRNAMKSDMSTKMESIKSGERIKSQ